MTVFKTEKRKAMQRKIKMNAALKKIIEQMAPPTMTSSYKERCQYFSDVNRILDIFNEIELERLLRALRPIMQYALKPKGIRHRNNNEKPFCSTEDISHGHGYKYKGDKGNLIYQEHPTFLETDSLNKILSVSKREGFEVRITPSSWDAFGQRLLVEYLHRNYNQKGTDK